jgi:hypothetical protein
MKNIQSESKQTGKSLDTISSVFVILFMVFLGVKNRLPASAENLTYGAFLALASTVFVYRLYASRKYRTPVRKWQIILAVISAAALIIVFLLPG